MFRFTAVARKLSPFCQFVKETHASSNRKMTMKSIGTKYRKLSPAQRTALVKRANKVPNKWGAKYFAFLASHKGKFTSMKPRDRQKKLGGLWRLERAKLERKQLKAAPSAVRTKPAKSAARRKVKKTARKTKANA